MLKLPWAIDRQELDGAQLLTWKPTGGVGPSPGTKSLYCNPELVVCIGICAMKEDKEVRDLSQTLTVPVTWPNIYLTYKYPKKLLFAGVRPHLRKCNRVAEERHTRASLSPTW
jgi:hypothetical protein